MDMRSDSSVGRAFGCYTPHLAHTGESEVTERSRDRNSLGAILLPPWINDFWITKDYYYFAKVCDMVTVIYMNEYLITARRILRENKYANG